jgi:hypothetical protein
MHKGRRKRFLSINAKVNPRIEEEIIKALAEHSLEFVNTYIVVNKEWKFI